MPGAIAGDVKSLYLVSGHVLKGRIWSLLGWDSLTLLLLLMLKVGICVVAVC